jgi:tRNA modification GTPase
VKRSNLDTSSTLFALCSGSLPSAIAVIRLSGPDAFSIAEKTIVDSNPAFQKKREMYLGEIVDSHKNKIDTGLILSF